MLNKVLLVGRLTTKPELRYTNTNVPYTRYSVAVDRGLNSDGERMTDFVNVVTWRKQAENMCTYLNKGSLVLIEGNIQTGSFTDKDGNKRYTTEVVAQNVRFLERKSNNETETEEAQYSNEDVFAQFGEDVVDIDDEFLD